MLHLFILLLCIRLVVSAISEEWNHHIDINKSGRLLHGSEVSVTCRECFAIGDFSLSGGCDTWPCEEFPDANFSSLPFDYNQPWIGVVVEDFRVHFDLEITLTPIEATQEITIPLLGAQGLSLPIGIQNVIDITWTFNPVIQGSFNASGAHTFCYGFEFDVPQNSAIWIPVVELDNITAIGFSQSSLKPFEYSSTNPAAEMDFNLSFRPMFSVSGSVLTFDVAQAEIYVDTPKLDVSVSQAMNVTQNCEPVPSGTPTDEIFNNMTHVLQNMSFDWGYNVTDIGDQIFPLGDTIALPTACIGRPSAAATV